MDHGQDTGKFIREFISLLGVFQFEKQLINFAGKFAVEIFMSVDHQLPDIVIKHQDPFRFAEGNRLKVVQRKVVDLLDDPVIPQSQVAFDYMLMLVAK